MNILLEISKYTLFFNVFQGKNLSHLLLLTIVYSFLIVAGDYKSNDFKENLYPNYKRYRKLITEVKDEMRKKSMRFNILKLEAISHFYKMSQIDP